MSNLAQNKKNKSKLNPVKAGLAGTAIVAAGVAAVALSKKGNRKKAGKVLKDLQAKGERLRKTASEKLDKVIKEEQNLHGKAQGALSKAKKVAKTRVVVSKKGNTKSSKRTK